MLERIGNRDGPLFLVLVAAALWRWRSAERPTYPWQWKAPQLGVALGLVTIAGWVLAKAGGSGFGPSTVGASASVASGSADWWLIAFLLAIVAGAAIAARTAGGWQLRGETPVRYGQLAVAGSCWGRAAGSRAAATSGTACPVRPS